MQKDINSGKNEKRRRPHHSKRRSRRKSNLIKRIKRKVKKDPVKVGAVFFGGILLIVITILFILYAKDTESKKNQLQKTETK